MADSSLCSREHAGNQLCQGPVPSRSQLCHLPCPTECQVSPWGAWGPCTFENCDDQAGKKGFKIRRRRVSNVPTGGPGSCPHLLEAVPCEDPRCHDWRLVSLDRCRPDDGKPCGPGTQTPQIQCVNSSGGEVDKSLCSSRLPPELVPCLVPCSRDCVLSDWTPWSSCSQTCSSKTIEGKQMRTRSILAYNAGEVRGGCHCKCQSDCNQYVWVAEPWSLWKVSNVDLKENCGEGVQTRKVRCMLNTIDGPSDAVEDYLCDPEEMPLGARESRLPCPDDCVLNDWGPWDRCSLPCTRMLSRVRTAFTIRAPSMGRQCPETTDAEACALNLNCFNYFYNITDWSTCQLSASAVCGTGTKTRMLDCVRSDGKSVNLKFCEELNLDRKWQMNTSCVVECPVNCQLSEWSVWSECSQTCGLQGKMWRQRSVVQAPQGDGRPCSPQMQQWKPCPARPCYQWQRGAWSECRVEGDVACGHGLRHRNTSCFVSDGSGRAPPSLVEEELCSGLQAVADGNKEMRLVESCTLPCPDSCIHHRSLHHKPTPQGECYLMEWSEWNPCVSVCAKEAGVDFGSVQVRVRPVMAQEPQNLQLCPDQAWESRPCTDGACYEYTWKSVRKTNSTEFNTWCQRSDGVNVTGGCPPINPPGDNSSCDPPCLSPKSFCSEAALCQCEEGYTEVLFFTGQLNHCAPIPVVEVPTAGDKKGDVKTSRAVNPTPPSTTQPGRSGRTWYLQPYGQDGKLKMWVYGVAAGATVLVLFIASMIYLACRSCAKVRRALQAEEAPCNGAVVWMGGDAHELTYTCPECQQSAHSEAVD
ncbi:unnamed protein product [Arctogadus glacialis]